MPWVPKAGPPLGSGEVRKSVRRGTTAGRGYGSAHQRQRARLIALHPLCQRCERWPSEHLHHRDANPWNKSDGNAELLCERCHQAHHRECGHGHHDHGHHHQGEERRGGS